MTCRLQSGSGRVCSAFGRDCEARMLQPRGPADILPAHRLEQEDRPMRFDRDDFELQCRGSAAASAAAASALAAAAAAAACCSAWSPAASGSAASSSGHAHAVAVRRARRLVRRRRQAGRRWRRRRSRTARPARQACAQSDTHRFACNVLRLDRAGLDRALRAGRVSATSRRRFVFYTSGGTVGLRRRPVGDGALLLPERPAHLSSTPPSSTSCRPGSARRAISPRPM